MLCCAFKTFGELGFQAANVNFHFQLRFFNATKAASLYSTATSAAFSAPLSLLDVSSAEERTVHLRCMSVFCTLCL